MVDEFTATQALVNLAVYYFNLVELVDGGALIFPAGPNQRANWVTSE